MSVFRRFECEAVKILARRRFPEDKTEEVLVAARLDFYEYTGSGYFLSVRHPSIPTECAVWHRPLVIGTFGDIQCGFIVFIEGAEMTLECHTWGAVDVPEDFREMEVEIRALG